MVERGLTNNFKMADEGEVDRLHKELAEKTAELKKLKDLLDEKVWTWMIL